MKHYFILGFFAGIGMAVTATVYDIAKSKGAPLP